VLQTNLFSNKRKYLSAKELVKILITYIIYGVEEFALNTELIVGG
jgi:hypothetical protein